MLSELLWSGKLLGRKDLVEGGHWHLAKEWDGTTARWPDDPPPEKDMLTLLGKGDHASRYVVSSTRAITIGRELPTDPIGIICAKDARGKSQYVLGGGKVQPDFDTGEKIRVEKGHMEHVRHCVFNEIHEELDLVVRSDQYFLVALRLIWDKDAEGKKIYQKDKDRGHTLVDAFYVAFTPERLMEFGGQQGETLERLVLPVTTLLQSTHPRDRGERLPILPPTHQLALAVAIVSLDEVFGNDLPEQYRAIVTSGLALAKKVISDSKLKHDILQVVPAMQVIPPSKIELEIAHSLALIEDVERSHSVALEMDSEICRTLPGAGS